MKPILACVNLASILALSILEIIDSNYFQTFANAIRADSEVLEFLDKTNNANIFVPAAGLLGCLDPQFSHDTLKYLIVDDNDLGDIQRKIEPRYFVKSLLGVPLRMENIGRKIHVGTGINTAEVLYSIKADNGWIHVIDTCLAAPFSFFETLSQAGISFYSTLEVNFEITNHQVESNQVTIFVPSREALMKSAPDASISSIGELATWFLTPRVLNAHTSNTYVFSTDAGSEEMPYTFETGSGEKALIIAGSSAKVQSVSTSSMIMDPHDIIFDGGVIHVIDSVFNPMVVSLPPGINEFSISRGMDRTTVNLDEYEKRACCEGFFQCCTTLLFTLACAACLSRVQANEEVRPSHTPQRKVVGLAHIEQVHQETNGSRK